MDSLWLVTVANLLSENGGREDGGAVSLRPVPCSKLFGRTVGDAQEKVQVLEAGPPPLMTHIIKNKVTKHLCASLARIACSRWHA